MGLISDAFRSIVESDHRLMERWAQIDEAPRYWISSDGRVWSEVSADFLRPYTNESGRYAVVSLYVEGQSGKVQRLVHGLVARHFLGERPEGHEVHHKDGDTRNNAASNLAYIEADENTVATPTETDTVFDNDEAEAPF